MAATLRHALKRVPVQWPAWLAAALLALVYLPLAGGLWQVLSPALGSAVWLALLADPQWPEALRLTLVSAAASSVLALALALLIAVRLYPGTGWQRLRARLPLWLSVPHAAFAIGLFFLLASSGWPARLFASLRGEGTPPDWLLVQDPNGLGLALGLALKECVFLLWMLATVLDEGIVHQQLTVARTLGYGPRQAWRRVVLPLVLPRLGWPLLAVWAYSLSVVDMALVLGPNTPPTLAVLAWQWLTDPDPARQALGHASATCLLALLLAGALATRWLWRVIARSRRLPDGRRHRPRALSASATACAAMSSRLRLSAASPLAALHWLLLAVLLLWSLADGWFFPAPWPEALTLAHWRGADWTPFAVSLALALGSSLFSLPLALLWLEWGSRRLDAMLYLPLILPMLPLAAAQYAVLLHSGLDGGLAAVWWSHLLWVFPYMLLTLSGPYRASDPRLMLIARALGQSRLQACLRVKWPLLLRPLLATLAVGFAVSIAQYLPTLFAGGGRVTTVTTEALTLASGGNRRLQAVQALLQLLLPLLAFTVANGLSGWAEHYRKGLR